MEAEKIIEVLPSIAIAQLFHAYGKLDEMISLGFDEPGDDFYMYFWELLPITTDFICADYDEYYNANRWYFSYRDMVEYYRLCRIYGSAHGLKLKNNPYMQEAERFVEGVMELGDGCGYGWYLQAKIGHEWASGIVLRTDCYFNGEMDLLEALLEIGDWYTRGVERLREKLAEEQKQPKIRQMEVLAA